MARKLRSVLRTWLCGMAVLVMVAPACLAQRYSFRDYTKGLGNLAVNCIAQDRTGYLWVGTENGLYRYDGLQFRQYGVPEGMRARDIYNLYLGPDGTLWVGSNDGVYFERRDGRFAEVRPPAPLGKFSQHMGTGFAGIAQDQVAMADQSGAFVLRRTESERWVAEPMHLGGTTI